MYTHPDFPNLHIVDHPLVQDKLTKMRAKACPGPRFKRLLKEIALLMGYELTQPLPMTTIAIETPMASMKAPALKDKPPVIVPILRAGLGMVEGLEQLIPEADIGHIGVYRDEKTKRPVEYLVKLPEPKGRLFIVVDPMLATGYSAKHALDVLMGRGVDKNNIRFMALVAVPEGVKVLSEAYPDVAIFVAALDNHLNENAFIVPGLGDAGDRLFGTQ